MNNNISTLKKLIEEAETIVIGAGAGLSTSAGFTYEGERFTRFFGDFISRYHFTDMYTAGFYPFPTWEEYWAYWSRYIHINRYTKAPLPVYEDLYALVKDKDYFVLTTNVDHCFQKAGFDKKRLFYTQGDYGLFQCSTPCHNKTYDNEEIIQEMVEKQKDMKIPSSLIPRCPICGKPMTINLRADQNFVEDEGWHEAAARYSQFISNHSHRKVLFLELGVGYNTPGIIKYPFMQMTRDWSEATYVSINQNDMYAPQEIRERSVLISDDIGCILKQLKTLVSI